MIKSGKPQAGIIAGYAIDNSQLSHITIALFDERATENAGEGAGVQLLSRSLPQEQLRAFLKNLPVFTKSGELDLNWLEGLHIRAFLTRKGGEWFLESLELDTLYYQNETEEK